MCTIKTLCPSKVGNLVQVLLVTLSKRIQNLVNIPEAVFTLYPVNYANYVIGHAPLIVLTDEIAPFRSRDINTDARYDNDALSCINARSMSCP